jgi:hypothetical protein
LEYFANPDNLNSDVLPPGLASWDPAPYLASAIPIAISVVGVNFVHELGHRIAGLIKKVKLGPTYFVPNLQVRAGVACRSASYSCLTSGVTNGWRGRKWSCGQSKGLCWDR